MTPREKLLIQATFERAIANGSLVGELFYRRLAEIEPSLYRGADGHDESRGRLLIRVMAQLVKRLDDVDDALAMARELGERYRLRHLTPSDYASVGRALLWALEAGIGGQFTPEVKQAWQALYGLAVEAMPRSDKVVVLRAVQSF